MDIASISMAMSQANVSNNACLSILKGAMEQSGEQMEELLEILAPLSESNIDISL